MSGLWLGASGLWRGTAGLYSGASSLALGTGLCIGGVTDYAITIPGAVITGGGPGVFDETTGASGVIATATTDLPDLGAGFKWGVVAGSDADISVASTATGQAATMDVSSARAIFDGDSANFTLRVENGTVGVDAGAQAIEFPFTATGTVAGYEAEASALFARFSVDPGATRKGHINTLIAALKTAGVWSLLDMFYVMAAHDSQAALLNWVSTSFNGTATSSPTFTTDRGYAGNGSSAYINTGFNPTTAPSPKYTQNSGHIGVWSRTNNSTSTYYDIGQLISGNLGLNCRSSSGSTMRGYLNSATVSNFGANGTSIGHLVLNRTVSTHHYGYFNGTATATVAATSNALTSSNVALMRAATNYSARELAVFHMGSALDDTKAAALYNAIQTYLVAVGAA